MLSTSNVVTPGQEVTVSYNGSAAVNKITFTPSVAGLPASAMTPTTLLISAKATGGPHQTGLLPPTASELSALATAEPLSIGRRPLSLASSIDLTSNMPPPGDQGQEGSCVAWATAYAYRGFLDQVEYQWGLERTSGPVVCDLCDPDHNFSPAYVYNQLNGGHDNGLDPIAALNLLRNQGVATLAEMPYVPGQYLLQPTASQIAAAAPFKIASFAKLGFSLYFININPSLTAIKAQLAAGHPVLIGVSVDDSFENLGANQIWKNFVGKNYGGHELVLVGYDDSRNAFEFQNSWGTSWGTGGRGWVDYNFLLTDMYDGAFVITNTVSPMPTSAATPIPTPTPTQSAKPSSTPRPTATPSSAPSPVTTSPPTVSITIYPVPSGNLGSLIGITSGPDGALWFAETVANKIGRITTSGDVTEYTIPASKADPWDIITGPDGALWFTQSAGGVSPVARVSTSGEFTEFPYSGIGCNYGITVGPDNALWFGTACFPGVLGSMTTSGALSGCNQFGNAFPQYVTVGPDGAFWFTEMASDFPYIGRTTTACKTQTYSVPAKYTVGEGITVGSDRALWFTLNSTSGSAIGRITVVGEVETFPLPETSSVGLMGIATGPDGAVWFAEGAGKIGRITTSGQITEYSTGGPSARGITAGPDGAIWFTAETGVGRAALHF